MNYKRMGRVFSKAIASICLALTCYLPAMAQGGTVDFSSDKMTVRKAISEFEKQTGKKIGVSERMDMNRTVDFGKTSVSVTEAADKIAGTGFYAIYYADFVIFAPGQALKATAPAAVPPIIIPDDQLKKFADYEKRDSNAYVPTLVYTGPYRAQAQDTRFYTPGDRTGGYVPSPFETAKKRERSKIMLKTNLAYWATLTPNLQAEFGLGNRTTLDVAGSYNPWNLEGDYGDNKKLVHWIGLAEYRYWFCERFAGSFIGVHALGTKYNVSGYKIPTLFEKDERYQGWGAGAGVSYGYMLPMGKRWAAEFNLGVGAVYMNYDVYECDKCGDKIESKDKVYFGPTRIGITLGYILK